MLRQEIGRRVFGFEFRRSTTELRPPLEREVSVERVAGQNAANGVHHSVHPSTLFFENGIDDISGDHTAFVCLFVCLLNAYSPANRTGSPQGFSYSAIQISWTMFPEPHNAIQISWTMFPEPHNAIQISWTMFPEPHNAIQISRAVFPENDNADSTSRAELANPSHRGDHSVHRGGPRSLAVDATIRQSDMILSCKLHVCDDKELLSRSKRSFAATTLGYFYRRRKSNHLAVTKTVSLFCNDKILAGRLQPRKRCAVRFSVSIYIS